MNLRTLAVLLAMFAAAMLLLSWVLPTRAAQPGAPAAFSNASAHR